MRYERIIMIVILVMLWSTPFLSGLVSSATSGLASIIMSIFGISGEHAANYNLSTVLVYISRALLS